MKNILNHTKTDKMLDVMGCN